ncbi:hypothetical protein [Plastoroseomonas arctica]|uniref:hypothetical protein n=1 Tax=Plastoroseomonas arctica TaxID=1509237 RepID=UPI001BAA1347|nr:hypothetical protein [Plastoroseomonas arctica]
MNKTLRLLAPLAFASLGLVTACASPQNDPPGTAAGRAVDRVAGTNTSGAYPAQSDGMPGNPPGTAVERAADRVAGTNTSGAYPRQGARPTRNLPGTAAQRAYDRRMGTNTSGAYPRNTRVVSRSGTPASQDPASGFSPAPGRNPSPQSESGSGNSLVQPGQTVAPNR